MANLADAERTLTSAEVERPLRRLLGVATGSTMRWQVERSHLRPGLDVSVLYRTTGPAERLAVFTTASVDARPFRVGRLRVRGWLHPDDPRLPGLAAAADADTVREWCGDEDARVDLVSYRPLRRAVLRATGREVNYFKVVRPDKADDLAARFAALGDVTPRILARPAPGVLHVAAARGSPLAESYVRWHSDPHELPRTDDIVALLDRMPDYVARLPLRPSWSDRIGFYADGARAVLPHRTADVSLIESRAAEISETRDLGPVTGTHGDFYEANIFVENRTPTQVIDVDSAGPGHRVDDLACLLGHATVLPGLSPRHYPRLDEVVRAWTRQFGDHVDPVALNARTAGVILSLTTGCSRDVASARLDLALRILPRLL